MRISWRVTSLILSGNLSLACLLTLSNSELMEYSFLQNEMVWLEGNCAGWAMHVLLINRLRQSRSIFNWSETLICSKTICTIKKGHFIRARMLMMYESCKCGYIYYLSLWNQMAIKMLNIFPAV